MAGVDLTPVARRVADRARMIAEGSDLPVEVVSVSEPVGEAFILDGLARLLSEHRQAELDNLMKWVNDRASVPMTGELLKGSPPWELVRRSKRAAMVVVGSSSVDVTRTGPVSSRVARKALSDVLVVRRQPRAPYRKVVVAVDFSELSKTAVERALRWVPDGEITVVFCLPTRFDASLSEAGMFEEELDASRKDRLRRAEEKMGSFVSEWGGVRSLVVDGPPQETIDEVVRRRAADLVVVGSRGAGATRMVLLGSVAEGLLAAAPCDVLVARVPGEFRRP
ncbi:MAG TPA: universal stress protein [Acidimicrobiia bacterium]